MQTTDVRHLTLLFRHEAEGFALREVAGLHPGRRGGDRVRQEVLVGPHDGVAGGDLDALGHELHALDRHLVSRAGYFFPRLAAIILAWSRWATNAGRVF